MSSDKIVWVDLEMSGLEIDKERIIEIAVAVTDGNLDNMVAGPNLIIHQSKELMDAMDPWCVKTHGDSGLTDAVLKSTVTEEEAEEAVLEFVKKHTAKGKSPLAGNSIYMDKMFLMKYMPRFADYLHYRLIDVSTVKELAKRWLPNIASQVPKKTDKHRAVDDIRQSIEELKYYQRAVFVTTDVTSTAV